MAKKSQRRAVRYDKDQAGCMWSFISMFDFRNGRLTRKLLSERRHSSRQVAGNGYSRSKLHILTNSSGKSQDNHEGDKEGIQKIDMGKVSVKDLMEKEMFNEQELNKLMSSSDTEAKKTSYKGSVRRNHKRGSKTSWSSCDLQLDVAATEDLVTGHSNHQDTEEKASKGLDLEVVVNELCHQINRESVNGLKHDKNNDLGSKSDKACPTTEENLNEAITMFVIQKFTDGKDLTEAGKIQHHKEFTDALQTLGSNKELIVKLLKDPNFLKVKHNEHPEKAPLESNLTSESWCRSNLLDAQLINSKPPQVITRKQHNLFRRKNKSQEEVLLKKDDSCRTSDRIVILKPLSGIQGSEVERKLRSKLQSHCSLDKKGQTERMATQFSFSEITRRLKHAMAKERSGQSAVPSDGTTKRAACEHKKMGNIDKNTGREGGAWNSPNRNHYYNEKYAMPSTGIRKKDKIGKLKDTEASIRNEMIGQPEQRVSDIYIEAKKHLSEIILSSGGEIEEFSSRRSPKTLGRVLSLPEFKFSPICSPRRDNEYISETTEKRLSPSNDLPMIDEIMQQPMQENHIIDLVPSGQNLKNQSCFRDDMNYEVKPCCSNPDLMDEIDCGNAADQRFCSTGAEKNPEGHMEIVKTIEAFAQEDCEALESSALQCSLTVTIDDQNGLLSEVCSQEESLKMDAFEEDQLLSSSLPSPPGSPIIKNIEDVESAKERPERPSPVSVLQPIFVEDDISPASIKSHPAIPLVQPLCIQFEGQVSSATDQEICIRAHLEDEESAFEYVEAVLLASDLKWDEFLFRWLSSDPILDPSLFNEVELFSSQSLHDQKLLFDGTNEILEEVCERYFSYSPWVSFVKHNIRPVPRGKDLIQEIWEGVEWNLSQPSACVLDQTVRRDMEKAEKWMDLRFDTESIGIEIGEAVFGELLEDTIFSFVHEGPKIPSSGGLTKLKDNDEDRLLCE